MALPRMKVQRFASYSIKSVHSYSAPSSIGDDSSVPAPNDLSCSTWDSGNNQQLNSHNRVWTTEANCLEESSSRVLVVEDSEPFRRFTCSTLSEAPDLQIVGEVSDGLEAVQKAQELQPDLIVLDIGLPSLNGIAAARRIRTVSPQSKILFVSQESSVDVVEEALDTGANGYVVKIDAGSQLLQAVSSVLRGEQFVGRRFSGIDFARIPDTGVSEKFHINDASASLQRDAGNARRHEAVFYSDDRYLLDDLTQFIGDSLRAGNAAIVVATETHRDDLLLRLQAHGLDIAAAIEQGRYISLDASETLSAFMRNGKPDPLRFSTLLGSLIATAAEATETEDARVVVFGECVHLLWAQGNAEAAIKVEKLGTHLARIYDVDILCGYCPNCVRGGMESGTFQQISAEHSAVYSR
jgi:CheY-like chemotaxis protein